MNQKLKVLVVGTGHMGASHARAYHQMDAVEICGLVSRSLSSSRALSEELNVSACFDDYVQALNETSPQAVSINSYTESHFEYAMEALHRGIHVFVEKPMAETLMECEEIIALAKEKKCKVVVGYILRHHPAWKKFIDISHQLGKPLVMRMNLNQQSKGEAWKTHRNILKTQSPIVDCGVHYVDVMCQMTESEPLRVHAIGARLTDDIPEGQYNYGQLQITFADGSCGWYEAGWGPMMSNHAHFIKDVIGPKGSVCIEARKEASDDVHAHTRTNQLHLHHSELNVEGEFGREDQFVDMAGEPDHDELCALEQDFFIDSIINDIDLGDHLELARRSLRIVLAADESFKTSRIVEL